MTRKGVWDLQDVRDKLLAGDPWEFSQTMYNWGSNPTGSLGHNNRSPSKQGITQLPGAYNQAFNSNGGISIQTKTDKTLWTCGYNTYGALGTNNPSNNHRSSPVQVPGTTWAAVDTGGYNGIATKTDGTLWTWGHNSFGELGQNNKTNYSSPKQVGSGTDWYGTGIQNADQRKIAMASNALAVKTDGTLWAWGQNNWGQLGQNNKTEYSSPRQIGSDTTWSFVSTGYYFCHAIKTDGTLWGWGINPGGQLGLNDNSHRSSPTQIPGTSWSKVQGGLADGACTALRTDGTAWVWGLNYGGCLGQNNLTNYSSPRQIGASHLWRQSQMGHSIWFGIRSDNALWSCGSYFQMPNTNVYRSSPVQVSSVEWTNDSPLYFKGAGNIIQPNMTPSEL
tara:strand:- start:2426 stop:3598 length:1173 start_codon:yes stop_codon:yes gene_type:complete